MKEGFSVEQMFGKTIFINRSKLNLEVWLEAIKPKRKSTLLRIVTPESTTVLNDKNNCIDLSKLFFKLRESDERI